MDLLIKKIAVRFKKLGGRALLVGGCVRDILLKIEPRDYDLEVYNLPLRKLKNALKTFGQIKEVGKSFGVLKLIYKGAEIDLSLPRKDSKKGAGHRGFKITTDPGMSFEEALRRRDFTINSILLDPLTKETIDPFGGARDLKNKILRVTDSKKFAEDPLRALRAMQLVGRFDLKIDPRSKKVIQNTVPAIAELSKDRIWQEWHKLFLKAEKPSLGLQAALDLGIIDRFYPQFATLKKTKQNPVWHPEGDVWEHTKMAVNNAAQISRREKLDIERFLVIVLTALCHDLGKGLVTRKINGVWRSLGHSKAGVEPGKKFLNDIGAPRKLHKKIIGLVKMHMKPRGYFMKNALNGEAVKTLARELSKYDLIIQDLALLVEANLKAKGFTTGQSQDLTAIAGRLKKIAQRLNLYKSEPVNIISGRDLLLLGLKPGKLMGEIIDLANALYDRGVPKPKILKTISNGRKNEKDIILTLRGLRKPWVFLTK